MIFRSLFGGGVPQIGYVYVEDADPGLMANAAAGATVSIPGRTAPWIIVDHTIGNIVVGRWPGRLWRVEITQGVPAEDQLAHGGVPGPEHGYTRAAAVKVLEELPLKALFGAHGEEVLRIIEAAQALTQEQAEALCEARHPDATEATARVWRAWLGDRKTAPGIEDFAFNGTLLMTNVGLPMSPVNRGLAVMHGQVFARAEEIAGPAATEEDGHDVWLLDPWLTASSALIDTALARGAPEAVTPQDREILLQAWARVFGA